MNNQESAQKMLPWIGAMANGDTVQAMFKGSPEPWENVHIDDLRDYLVAGDFDLRIKPKTIMCNGFEVPAPETEAPDKGALIYIVTIHNERGQPAQEMPQNSNYWCGSINQIYWLEMGMVYLESTDAAKRAKAMMGVDPDA